MFPEMLGYETNINNAQRQGLLGGAAALFGPRQGRGGAVFQNMLAGQRAGAALDAEEAERQRKALELQKKRQAAQFFYPTLNAEQLSRMPETALDDMLSTGVDNQFGMTPQVKHFNLSQENPAFGDFVNPPPDGYVYGDADPETGIRPQIPRPGSKAAQEAADIKRAAGARETNETQTADVFLRKSAEAISLIEEHGSGVAGFGAVGQVIPESDARTLSKNIETMKAIIGFDSLQKIRDQSPTGGALGQVAIRELDFLQAKQGSLDQFQSPEVLANNMREIRESYAMVYAINTGDTSQLTREQKLDLARAWENDFGGGAQ